MTREEAIQEFQNVKDLVKQDGKDWFDERDLELIDMAIEALQREEAEEKGYCHRIKPKEYFKDDAINRADAMVEFREWVKRANENGETPTWNDAVSLIGSLPSAEQVASKLNNPCNSLLTDESNGSKEHKSKLDLISRQDVIEALSRSSVYAWSIEQDQTAHNWALNIIKALPSAEEYDDYEHATLVDIKEPLKVEVVRCKDCRHYEKFNYEAPSGYDGWCNTPVIYADGHYTNALHFCSYRERKEP